MATDDVTVTIEVEGGTDEVEIPEGLLDRLAEPEESRADVVGSIVLMAFTGRAHALVHHAEGEEADAELDEIEDAMLERFEERFGMTYGEATGHSH